MPAMRSRRGRRAIGFAGALASAIGAVGLAAGSARAQEAEGGDTDAGVDPDGKPATPNPAPPVGLDALLRLPSEAPRPDPGGSKPAGEGRDRSYWESRFATVRGDLDEAQTSLERAQTELEEMARKTEGWQMAAPGAQVTAENTPVSYKLRQDIRRYREDVESAQRRLRDLEVEASLAGVPPEWRDTTHRDASPDPAP